LAQVVACAMSAGTRRVTAGSPKKARMPKGKGENGHVAGLSASGLSFRRSLLHFLTALLVALGLLVVPIEVLTLTAVTVCSLMWLGESFKGRGGYVDEFGHFVARHFGGRSYEFTSVNGVTWYVTGLVLTSFIGLARGSGPCLVGVLTLGFGDPAAAWVGKRYGSQRFPNGKSVEGFAAFVVASALVTALVAFPFPHLAVGSRATVAGALSGALAELLCPSGDRTWLNDNLVIPVAATLAAAFL